MWIDKNCENVRKIDWFETNHFWKRHADAKVVKFYAFLTNRTHIYSFVCFFCLMGLLLLFYCVDDENVRRSGKNIQWNIYISNQPASQRASPPHQTGIKLFYFFVRLTFLKTKVEFFSNCVRWWIFISDGRIYEAYGFLIARLSGRKITFFLSRIHSFKHTDTQSIFITLQVRENGPKVTEGRRNTFVLILNQFHFCR